MRLSTSTNIMNFDHGKPYMVSFEHAVSTCAAAGYRYLDINLCGMSRAGKRFAPMTEDNWEEQAHAWRQLVVKRKSAGPAIGKPTPVSNQLFFMASYDVDRFRAFVMSESFNETYDIPVEVMATLVADDEALLDFGLNFLRHALFGEKFVEERPDAYEKRLARRRTMAEQQKEAEFQQKMDLEDDKYSGEH